MYIIKKKTYNSFDWDGSEGWGSSISSSFSSSNSTLISSLEGMGVAFEGAESLLVEADLWGAG